MINRLSFVKVFNYWLKKSQEICNPTKNRFILRLKCKDLKTECWHKLCEAGDTTNNDPFWLPETLHRQWDTYLRQ